MLALGFVSPDSFLLLQGPGTLGSSLFAYDLCSPGFPLSLHGTSYSDPLLLMCENAFLDFSLFSRNIVHMDFLLFTFAATHTDLLLPVLSCASFASFVPLRGLACLDLATLIHDPGSSDSLLLLRSISCADLLLLPFASASLESLISVSGLAHLASTMFLRGASCLGPTLLVLDMGSFGSLSLPQGML